MNPDEPNDPSKTGELHGNVAVDLRPPCFAHSSFAQSQIQNTAAVAFHRRRATRRVRQSRPNAAVAVHQAYSLRSSSRRRQPRCGNPSTRPVDSADKGTLESVPRRAQVSTQVHHDTAHTITLRGGDRLTGPSPLN